MNTDKPYNLDEMIEDAMEHLRRSIGIRVGKLQAKTRREFESSPYWRSEDKRQ